MDSNAPLVPVEMQANVEMDDLTREDDHPTVDILQPNRKVGNDNGDGGDDSENNRSGNGDSNGGGEEDGNGNGNHGNEKENLIKIIERGNIDDITQKLTPKAMAKCGRNALLVAMEANSKLRSLAKEKGPGAEELAKMASSVGEFTSCLLDPLKSNMEARHVFGDSLDDLMDAGIDKEQKTFFAHPVIFNLMSDKWLGMFGKMKRCSWLSRQHWLWIFLHIWCLFDLVLFPFLFAVFYIKHRRNKNKLKDKGIEVAFVINATSKIADEAFKLMKISIKEFVDKHGDERTKYQVVVHGDDSSPRKMCSKSDLDKLELKRGTTKIPALHEDLKNADFVIRRSKTKSEKVIIFFTDHKTSLKHERVLVENQVKAMKDIKLLPIAVGSEVNIQELERITYNKLDIIHFGEYEKPETVSKRIWHELQGKDMYESYHEYFMTPYFIFVRDTLSYLALLGLHFALCLSPSVIPFNSLEWVILVFFMGRIVMESKQFRNVKIDRGKGILIKRQTGNKYTRCSENEDRGAKKELYDENEEGEEDEQSQSCGVSRSTVFAKMCGKYLSDRWNILDSITLVTYLITFLLRMLTWVTSASVTNNRALVIAGYLYGLNTMFLTLRAFGHVMETIQGIGTIQIALFQIIGDIATIFWQFVATILAFSIAITKVYMAEKSYIAQESYRDNLACNTSGISCWWAMFKHLCWSLMGIAELDPLDSVDSASVTFAKFLFGAFLIMGVILLVNMMIALLSNTYQRVEDNAYKEWSFKKAITIQTYSNYHPIPVPLNLISNLFVGVKCMACCKGQEDVNDAKNKSLDAVVQCLEQKYFAAYGYSFPLTDDRKMDQLIQETERNREMFNQIAHRTFTTHAPDQRMLPTGQKAWQSQGIRIEGSLLVCEGGNYCQTCEGESDECHGARYLVPFSPEFPHLEVLIQETDEQRCLGVGVVWKDYGNHAMPGQTKRTVGYLVDEGKIFGPFKPVNLAGKEYEGAMAYRGDLIRCTVVFQDLKDGKVPIQFTLNGKQVTQDQILIEYNPSEKSLYPFISMGHTGIRVLAKLCPSPNDDAHLIGTIKATTDSMAEKMTSNWRQVDTIVERINGELNNADKEFETLNDIVLEELGHFEELINDPDQVGRDEAIDVLEEIVTAVYPSRTLSCPVQEFMISYEACKLKRKNEVNESLINKSVLEPIREQEISHLNEKDGPGLEDQQPQNSLLKRAHENLEELKQTADYKFASVLKSLEAAENDAKERMRYQKEKIERVKINLSHIQVSLKDLLKSRISHSRVQSLRPNYIYEPPIQMQIQ